MLPTILWAAGSIMFLICLPICAYVCTGVLAKAFSDRLAVKFCSLFLLLFTNFNKDMTNESASAAMYGYESWTLRKNEETCLGTFEMKGLRKILRVSWTAKKTIEWVLNKAGVKRELLDTLKQGSQHTMITS